MDVFVVLDQGVDGFGCELKGDLVLQHHIDMDHIRFDMDDLVVEQGLDQRVGVLAEVDLGCFGQHNGAEGPYGRGRGQCLCQTARVLLDAIQGALDTVDSF